MEKLIYGFYILHAVCVALLMLNILHDNDPWYVKLLISIAAIAEIVFTVVYILLASG